MNVRLNARCWPVMMVYLLAGLLLGLADPQFRRWAQALGIKPGVGTAISVNVLLPLLAICMAAVLPRLQTVWLGTILTTCAFAAGLAVNYVAPPWNIGLLVRSVPPVLMLACLGCGVLGTLVAMIVRSLRKRQSADGPARSSSP